MKIINSFFRLFELKDTLSVVEQILVNGTFPNILTPTSLVYAKVTLLTFDWTYVSLWQVNNSEVCQFTGKEASVIIYAVGATISCLDKYIRWSRFGLWLRHLRNGRCRQRICLFSLSNYPGGICSYGIHRFLWLHRQRCLVSCN